MPEWRLQLGANVGPGGTTFRVWAPEHDRIDVLLHGVARRLTRDGDGYWTGTFDDIGPGALYQYRINADERATFPDPASRYQPYGVHGPSQVVDPRAFAWTDATWQPPTLEDTVFYELHVGTFTPSGTFRGIQERLDHVRDLGVSTIELMPVGDFPGERNWGYDGVAIYAPARCYGTPDDLRALVDAAHAHGIAVCLDVVYNHLGPDGAYATVFSPHYFTDRHSSPWGSGVNLDGPHSEHVRAFFIDNALHWIHEYHVDALRLDATHALQDDRPGHFLAELASAVRSHTPKPILLIAEDSRNLVRLIEPIERGGYGLDAVWADDFHHQARVHTAHDRESYYRDYTGSATDLATTIQQGWFFTGQHSTHLNARRGDDPSPAAPQRFVFCIQNHDQIGNRADGARLNHQIDPAAYRALSVLLLLVPETPLLFMGQEWAATTPFLFFTDHHEELGRLVTAGRREEFSGFAAFTDPVTRAHIPDPQQAHTFENSRLRWTESEAPEHDSVQRLYQRLLRLRRDIPPPARDQFVARALDAHSLVVSLFAPGDSHGHIVVARLSGGAGEVKVTVAGDESAAVVLTTEDCDVAVDAKPIEINRESQLSIRFARPGAVVLGGRLAS
jgi:maltooligosyltrehalose trehalohydrolase